MSEQCQAYVESRRVPLARGGWRHMRCRKRAVTERTRDEVVGLATAAAPRTYQLCGTHAAMWDSPLRYNPILRSDG